MFKNHHANTQGSGGVVCSPKAGDCWRCRESHGGPEPFSLDQARTQAVVASGEALKDLSGLFWKSGAWRMWVTDESGATVCTLTFAAE